MKNQKGFSLIELLIVVAIIGIIAAIAIPNLLAARRASNESAAIATMKTITSAEATYFSTKGQGNVYANQAGLKTEKLLDDVVGDPDAVKSGYKYEVTAVTSGFDATGTSQSASTGSRSFYTNEAGVIYGTIAPDTVAPGRDTAGDATHPSIK